MSMNLCLFNTLPAICSHVLWYAERARVYEPDDYTTTARLAVWWQRLTRHQHPASSIIQTLFTDTARALEQESHTGSKGLKSQIYMYNRRDTQKRSHSCVCSQTHTHAHTNHKHHIETQLTCQLKQLRQRSVSVDIIMLYTGDHSVYFCPPSVCPRVTGVKRAFSAYGKTNSP